jgi:hypothetical protein
VDHAFAGFVSLGARLTCRNWRYIYVAAAFVLPMLPYVLGEPIIRYRFPVGGLLVFPAADIVWRTAQSALKLPPQAGVLARLGFSLTSCRKDSCPLAERRAAAFKGLKFGTRPEVRRPSVSNS